MCIWREGLLFCLIVLAHNTCSYQVKCVEYIASNYFFSKSEIQFPDDHYLV